MYVCVCMSRFSLSLFIFLSQSVYLTAHLSIRPCPPSPSLPAVYLSTLGVSLSLLSLSSGLELTLVGRSGRGGGGVQA